jgi:hypothetical protein
MVAAYTAQFGNGVSATISAEQARRTGTVFIGTSRATGDVQYDLITLANPVGNNLGSLGVANTGLQDIVANLRVDQAWGGAQISGAIGDRNAGYYGTTEPTGHPSNTWGWAVAGGLRLNAPMIGPGDYFQIQGIYSQGMTGYLSQTPRGAPLNKWSGDSVGYGFWEDGVYTGTAGATSGNIELTTGWSVFASYEHFWTPSLRTSVYGSYINLQHNDSAKAAMCNGVNRERISTAGINIAPAQANAFQGSVATGCNPDWSSWNVGTRSQWNVTKDLYVGIDLIYMKLNTATAGNSNTVTILDRSGAKPAQAYRVEDQDAFAATWRIHRDIVP